MQALDQTQTPLAAEQNAALMHEINALKIVVQQLVRVVVGSEEGLAHYLNESESTQD